MIKEKIDICFIILHYMDMKLTERTVESILGLDQIQDCKIIIVDNASLNRSGQMLVEKYCNNRMIHVILSKVNGGFAKGNNLGYEYCLEHYDTDFVIAANNDVIFSQKEFIPLLYECYEQDKFYVAGPDTFVPYHQYHQSPLSMSVRDDLQMEYCIQKEMKKIKTYSRKVSLKLVRMFLIEKLKNTTLQKVFKIYRFIKPQKDIQWKELKKNVVLMGACLIFSDQYCEQNRELFEPLTFMYGEEDFLALKCVTNGGSTTYIPKLKVMHISQGSSQSNKQSFKEFKNNKIKRSSDAIRICRLYIEKYRELGLAGMDRKW